ncbi:hypothetical protein EYC98_02215 [Halieaceae bacterium IMCC14734]|uniref:Uncharacterized protein n=1 Tax=Candidatus Litorirhabdus singularis TaxID=2518993 RepID=A0ABT3TBM4_9GAMM|nr:hypothetical protein [Candidatus Litorirhabdus singularis]MCX2979672.1 hypothetical protein [Candidatus Litorirhabdus singularis]
MTPLRIWLSGCFGAVLLLIGVAVFLIRMHHAGPYAMPAGGNLLAGIMALVAGGLMLSPLARKQGRASLLNWLILLASPIILFFALYATLAELEEVVVIEARDNGGQPAYLRLWVVDHKDAVWVIMPGAKSDHYQLEKGPVILMRDGRKRCVVATRSDNLDNVNEIVRGRHEKYFVQRLAEGIGLFSEQATPATAALRLDPCG